MIIGKIRQCYAEMTGGVVDLCTSHNVLRPARSCGMLSFPWRRTSTQTNEWSRTILARNVLHNNFRWARCRKKPTWNHQSADLNCSATCTEFFLNCVQTSFLFFSRGTHKLSWMRTPAHVNFQNARHILDQLALYPNMLVCTVHVFQKRGRTQCRSRA